MRSNLQSVRIIHGKGTGALRAAVHQSLRKNKQERAVPSPACFLKILRQTL